MTRSRKLFISSVFVGLAVGALVLWNSGGLWGRDRLKKKLISELVEQVQPKIPWKIEKLDFDGSWEDIQRGALKRITLVLSKNGVRVGIQGPIDVDRIEGEGLFGDDLFRIGFHPEIRLSLPGEDLSPIHFDLSMDVSGKPWERFADPLTASVHWKEKVWEWKSRGLKLSGLDLSARWKSAYSDDDAALEEGESITPNAQLSFKLADFDFQDPKKKDRALHVKAPHLEAETRLEIDPYDLGPIGDAKIRAEAAEWIDGDTFIEIPNLAEFPLHIASKLSESSQSGIPVTGADTTLGARSKPWGKTQIRFVQDPQGGHWQLDLKSAALPVKGLFSLASKLPWLAELHALEGLEFQEGDLVVHAQATAKDLESGIEKYSAELDLDHLTLRSPEKSFALRGGKLHALAHGTPHHDPRKAELRVESELTLPEIYFKKFKASLPSFPISARSKGGNWTIEMPRGLPLAIRDIPLTLGPIGATFTKNTEGGLNLHLLTSAKLASTGAAPFYQGVCADPAKVPPPVSVHADFPRIELTSNSVEIDGGVQAELFGGHFKAGQFALYDPFSEIPEFRANVEWDGIRLDEVGKWSGFGKMDGILHGYVKNLISRAWLPPNYELLVEAKPLSERQIVFSGQAMKNVLNIIAPGTGEKYTGIAPLDSTARWVMFGFPSDLVGGWDVSEVGVRVRSQDGSMLVETTTSDRVFRNEGKHFIMYADPVGIWPVLKSRVRVGWDLKQDHQPYPLIMDSAGFYLTLQQYLRYAANIAARERAAAQAKNPKLSTDGAPENEISYDLNCQPPEF